MCAIVDANVAGQVFGGTPTPAGKFFLEWLNSRGKLAVGGDVRRELFSHHKFRNWLQTALRIGRARSINDDLVEAETAAVQGQRICRSDDPHVLALAQVSGARLLFTNDYDLQEDFGNHHIIEGVRGRVYTTVLYEDVRDSHRDLLRRTDLCAW